jgi:hypothetical protein
MNFTGKTTQVPQFILDDAEMGATCRIAGMFDLILHS